MANAYNLGLYIVLLPKKYWKNQNKLRIKNKSGHGDIFL